MTAPTAPPALVTSLIRTLVPYLVGFLLSIPCAPRVIDFFGVDTDTARRFLTNVTMFVLGLLYYVIVRLVERHHPKAGRLLGIPRIPTYGQQ